MAALLLRMFFIAHYSRIAGDTLVYGDIAKTLLLHRTYGLTDDATFRPTLIRMPGYPMFLALCFRLFGMMNYFSALYVQAAADLLTCCLVSATAGRIFGKRAVLPVLWIAALNPFTASYVAAALTEALVVAFVALTFYGMVRWRDAGLGFNRWLWVVSIALGCGILLRPEQGLLAAATMPPMLWMAWKTPERRRRLVASALPVALAAVCVLLPLVPWTARNWRVFHVVEPLAPATASDPGEVVGTGFSHWYRSWAIEFSSTNDVAWPYDDTAIDISTLPARAFSRGCFSNAGELRDRTVALFSQYNVVTTASVAFDNRFAELANERRKASPVCYYVVFPVGRVLDMLLRPRTEMMPINSEWWHWRRTPGQTAFAAAYGLLNFAYLGAAVAGLLAWRRRGWLGAREIAWAMAASIVLRCFALLSLDISEPRFTLEFFPVVFVWAGGLFARRGDA